MKECPAGKDTCPCEEFSKEGLCDWPYRTDMSPEEIKYTTQVLRVVDGKESSEEDRK